MICIPFVLHAVKVVHDVCAHVCVCSGEIRFHSLVPFFADVFCSLFFLTRDSERISSKGMFHFYTGLVKQR